MVMAKTLNCKSLYIRLLTGLFLLTLFPLAIVSEESDIPQQCGRDAHKCGSLDVPFPFFVNRPSSSPPCSLPDAFGLTCLQLNNLDPYLFLSIKRTSGDGLKGYQVLQFFPDGILVDFSQTASLSDQSSANLSTSSCVEYNDLKSFGFQGREDYFGISADNVLGLYDCEDSSLCKPDCVNTSTILMPPGCSKNHSNYHAACCYPLSDQSYWHPGDDLSIFSQFGCRGFSSWVVVPYDNTTSNYGHAARKRGVKLEWAFPANTNNTNSSYKGAVASSFCAPNAYIVNATTIASGIRCKCEDGFTGDGFTKGVGCLKSCQVDEKQTHGKGCYTKRRPARKLEVLAGVLTSAFCVASLIALCCLLKRHNRSGTFQPHQDHCESSISFGCRTRLFTYHELEEATKGFADCKKLVSSTTGELYTGVLGNGLKVVVHKVQCGSKGDLMQILSQVEVLSAVSHKSMARVLGCSIDCGDAPLVVYEDPANGTLLEYLHQNRQDNKNGLDWYTRLNIVTETSSVLAFLQCEICPPILHNDFQSGYILLDQEFSARLAGFVLLTGQTGPDHSLGSRGLHHFHRSDVYNLGLVLLEIIVGSTLVPLDIDLQKIRGGKLEEIVDPLLYYHEQPSFVKEQIERVADLATRCLLFGGDGKLSMMDAARELLHIRTSTGTGGGGGSSRRGPALEETFSNSSLLQMMSMSPDSIYLPHFSTNP
ncbi:probably inactive receptor-like protein kinase At2g46850 [Daucus carota subsp. sativus]|nr:PREDICTED: probably inactive receptor-like protein kinase At2g46850 [Daucus carota subsp. sativus]